MTLEQHLTEPIKEFYERERRVEKRVDTLKFELSMAYDNVVNACLRDENGLIDYEKLDEASVQDKLFAQLIEAYQHVAQVVWHVGAPQDEIDRARNMILLGIPQAQLLAGIRKYGSQFKKDAYQSMIEEAVKERAGTLHSTVNEHLKDEHLNDILRYTGTEPYLKKESLNVQEHGSLLLRIFKQLGTVTPIILERNLGKKYLKDDVLAGLSRTYPAAMA